MSAGVIHSGSDGAEATAAWIRLVLVLVPVMMLEVLILELISNLALGFGEGLETGRYSTSMTLEGFGLDTGGVLGAGGSGAGAEKEGLIGCSTGLGVFSL